MREDGTPNDKTASRKVEVIGLTTSGELAFLASRVCLPQVTNGTGIAGGDLASSLTEHGYKLASAQTSRELFGRVVDGFVAARKQSELGRFMIAFGEGLPACVVMLTDDSTVPPVKELRQAFEGRGWEWAHMGAVRPERLPYAAFKTTDKQGKTILAVLRDEPASDPKVRLGLEISYTDF